MFDLWCCTCALTYLVGPRRLISLRNTSCGPVGHARCPEGHVMVVDFHGGAGSAERRTRPGSAA